MGGPVQKKGKKKAEPPNNEPEEKNPFLVPRNPDAERERGRVNAVPVKVTPPEGKEPPQYSRGRKRNREPEPKMNDRISRLGTRWGRGRRRQGKK
ncbi:MAG: hypothetical protein ACLFUZ_02470 [Candidatus Micrarchaeia archaeon]